MPDDRQEQARRNRKQMPEFAAFVDAIRAWCPRAAVVWAEEGGGRMGRPRPADAARSMNIEQWQRWVQTGELPAGKVSPWKAVP